MAGVLRSGQAFCRGFKRTSYAANRVILNQKRFLNLHEYQSKDLLRSFGLNVQKGAVASSVNEAFAVAENLKREGAEELILKAQVLAGGRGKGKLTSGLQGGVKICKSADEVRDYTKDMLGYNLITHQTTEEGQKVNKVLVHEGVNIVKELYLAILLDRAHNGPVIVASLEGGMDIEEVARDRPDAIAMVPLDVSKGMTPDRAEAVATALGFSGAQAAEVGEQVKRLYKLFVDCDAVQVEINPLAVTDAPTNNVVCVDAKINFDDNASYRQKHLFEMEDEETKDPREVQADKVGLNYIGLQGNIGCLVNGAGLAMATMDIVKLYGGIPANFLDVGGSATKEQVATAFGIIQSDPAVRAIFVNIFGGIMRCDVIAEGIVHAAKQVKLELPLVVRLNGTNVEKGREILRASGIKCEVFEDFEEAARKACSTV